MYHQFLSTYGKEVLNRRRLIYIYISDQHLIFEVPYLELLVCVNNHQMASQSNL